MASSRSTTHHHRGQMAVLLLLASAVAMPAAAAAASGAACGSEKFPAGRSYATCSDLPTLGAALHWTYDAAASSLSVAFVVPTPAGGAGWVSWGINPTGDGMKGAQALLAFRGASGAYVVNTYNLTGYRALGAASTPIAFEPTDLAADESAGGKVRLYGKLQLPKEMVAVNHIWQVGSAVASGAPVKHAFDKENLEAEGRLVLAGGGGGASEPAPAPEAGGEDGEVESESETTSSLSPAPAGAQKPATAASTYASAPVLMVLACVGFLVTMISH